MTEVLAFEGVTLSRDGNEILRGIDFHVDGADRWVVLGPNGAGKTSLIAIAAARSHPSGGEARVLGEVLGEADTQELRTRVGLSSAALADRIPPEEPVRDVVMTAAHGITGRWREEYEETDEQRAAALLEAFGMTDFAEREFWTLSEGERKRVQIARALMADPELLLLDEPAAGLDLGAREALMRRLTRVMASPEGPVLVMVSHHVEEIPPGVTHVLLLRNGAVTASGPIAEVLT